MMPHVTRYITMIVDCPVNQMTTAYSGCSIALDNQRMNHGQHPVCLVACRVSVHSKVRSPAPELRHLRQEFRSAELGTKTASSHGSALTTTRS